VKCYQLDGQNKYPLLKLPTLQKDCISPSCEDCLIFIRAS
jgi:hypothetical protein